MAATLMAGIPMPDMEDMPMVDMRTEDTPIRLRIMPAMAHTPGISAIQIMVSYTTTAVTIITPGTTAPGITAGTTMVGDVTGVWA